MAMLNKPIIYLSGGDKNSGNDIRGVSVKTANTASHSGSDQVFTNVRVYHGMR